MENAFWEHTKSLTFIGFKKKRRQLTTKSIVPSALEIFKKENTNKTASDSKTSILTTNISKTIGKKACVQNSISFMVAENVGNAFGPST